MLAMDIVLVGHLKKNGKKPKASQVQESVDIKI